jgi:hypothetical protein
MLAGQIRWVRVQINALRVRARLGLRLYFIFVRVLKQYSNAHATSTALATLRFPFIRLNSSAP